MTAKTDKKLACDEQPVDECYFCDDAIEDDRTVNGAWHMPCWREFRRRLITNRCIICNQLFGAAETAKHITRHDGCEMYRKLTGYPGE